MYREMKYAEELYQTPILLYHEYYDDYEVYILNRGTHPCAYIVLPEGHLFYNVRYDCLEIPCHRGVTYSEHYLIQEKRDNYNHMYYVRDRWVIGWDYNHLGDYNGRLNGFYKNEKKWTTEEMIAECEEVIDYLK